MHHKNFQQHKSRADQQSTIISQSFPLKTTNFRIISNQDGQIKHQTSIFSCLQFAVIKKMAACRFYHNP